MPAFVVRGGPSAGERIEVAGETELGRAASPALQEDAEISRRHAVTRSGAQGLEIEDAGSSNGTFVNEERISGTRRLSHGDRVRIGQTILEVDNSEAAPPMGAAAAGAAAAGGAAARPGAPATPAGPQEPAAPVPPGGGTQPSPPVEPAAPRQTPPTQQPVAPQQPAAGAQAPQAPYPQGSTAPQQPVAQTYGQPQAYGQPAYGQPAYGRPAYGQPPGAVSGRRSGAVVSAAVFLFLAALVGLIYGLYAFLNNVNLVIDFFDEAPITFLLFYGLLIPAVIMAVLQIIGGVRVLGLRGRGLALVASIIALLIWGAELVIAITEGAGDLDFIVIPLAIVLGLVAVVLLAAAGGAFAARRSGY
jgi:FHA domain